MIISIRHIGRVFGAARAARDARDAVHRLSAWAAALTCLAFMAMAPAAHAINPDNVIPSVSLTCDTCATVAQFQAVATAYFRQYKYATPPGFQAGQKLQPCYWARYNPGTGDYLEVINDNCTVAVITSKQYPLTAGMEFSSLVDNDVFASAFTPTDQSTRDMDNRLTARAAAIPPIQLPPGINPGDNFQTIISPAVNQALEFHVTTIHTDFWHGLLNHGQYVSVVVTNHQDNKAYMLWVGDSITVRFANNYTMKLTLTSPLPGQHFVPNPGTLRDANGRDPNNPRPNTGAYRATGQTFAYSYGGNTITVSYVPVYYNVPGSRIERQGVITVETIQTGMPDKTNPYLE